MSSTPILPYNDQQTIPAWAVTEVDEDGQISLIAGQDYNDVVFANEKATANWVPDRMQVEYALPSDPPEVVSFRMVSNKTTTGCRAYFDVMPPDGNYLLNWSITI